MKERAGHIFCHYHPPAVDEDGGARVMRRRVLAIGAPGMCDYSATVDRKSGSLLFLGPS
jgi:hypothetical protein